MRRITRLNLEDRAQRYLSKKQKDANLKLAAGNLDTTQHWKYARHSTTLNKVLGVLQRMMGERQRCMYCLDSHGSDIEHFRPKAAFPKRMFKWRNLLLCCSECGRIKGNRFPLQGKRPLLIDPTKEQPWRYIDFDPMTGNLVARFDSCIGAYSAKGESTVDTLQLDRREALAAGYKRTFKKLSKTVETFLSTPGDSTALLAQLREEDDHGLLGWIFVGTGKHVEPFAQSHQSHRDIWTVCLKVLTDDVQL